MELTPHNKINTKAGGKKAIIYLRVSTEEQVDNFSLDSQEEICRREAEHKCYEITGVFREEGRSAKNILGRPVLLQLLEYCRTHKHTLNAVFVYRLDRISRQTSDYLAIRKKLAEYGINNPRAYARGFKRRVQAKLVQNPLDLEGRCRI